MAASLGVRDRVLAQFQTAHRKTECHDDLCGTFTDVRSFLVTELGGGKGPDRGRLPVGKTLCQQIHKYINMQSEEELGWCANWEI